MAKEDNIMLFDLDGSLADYDKAMLGDLWSLMSPRDKQFLDDLEVTLEYAYHYMQLDWLKERSRFISRTTGWWENLEPIALGFEVLRLAFQIGFDIHILTQASVKKSNAWKEKINWCKKHIYIEHKITITQNKGIVYGKVLFDDWPNYIMNWLEWRPRGLVIMPIHPGPAQERFAHPNVVKLDDTEDSLKKVEKAMTIAYERKSLEKLNITI